MSADIIAFLSRIGRDFTRPELAEEARRLANGLSAKAEPCREMVAPRTDAEIVSQTEALAAKLNDWRWGGKLTRGTYRASKALKARACWQMACAIQEMLTQTDPENAAAEIDDAEGGVA